MRVTNNMLVNNMVYNLNQNLKVLEKLQYQKASGKKNLECPLIILLELVNP